jgi:hypothetical protein
MLDQTATTAQAPPELHAGRHRRLGLWQALGLLVVLADLVLVAHVVGAGMSKADDIVSPVSYLGTTFDQTGCGTAPLGVGKGIVVSCASWSAVTDFDHTAKVVSLFAGGVAGFDEFPGRLPQSLTWRETLPQVTRALGQPRQIMTVYGPPMLVYMYAGPSYGSLELQFDELDRLVRINAALWH